MLDSFDSIADDDNDDNSVFDDEEEDEIEALALAVQEYGDVDTDPAR